MRRLSKPGDLWMLGPHRLLCGDARSAADITRLIPARVLRNPVVSNRKGALSRRR
jgi:hypothetical protein